MHQSLRVFLSFTLLAILSFAPSATAQDAPEPKCPVTGKPSSAAFTTTYEDIDHFFEDINMKRQLNKQEAFISAALGGPEPWTGKDLRKVHASLDLTETDFGIIAGHLQATLKELKVDVELIGKILAIVGSTKDAVLNKKQPKAE